MLIDCHSCLAGPRACGDCVVTVLLGPPQPVGSRLPELDAEDRAAVDVLARNGLVPPLRLVPAVDGTDRDGARRAG
ncbi:hypothetical protein ACFFKU_11400 [Kineococcus gynurae]|uniref:Uncharacterized protein n=1 Tax=Kineococcus gynurae TaxID=452979 RepID=A0ABV5LUF8_9ACTN